MNTFLIRFFGTAIYLIILVGLSANFASAQKFDSIERGRMKDTLKTVKNSIKKYYYDQTFRGIDLMPDSKRQKNG